VDWLIDRHDPDSTERALSELDDHLRRHAVFDSAVPDTMEHVRTVVDEHQNDAISQRLYLNWWGARPRVALASVTDEKLRALTIPAGTAVPAEHRAALDSATGDRLAELTLDLERRAQDVFSAGPPPMPEIGVDPRRDGVASVAAALTGAAGAHPSADPAQMASLAGTALADAALHGQDPTDGAEAARRVVEVHEALGSEAHVLAIEEDAVEVAFTRCPFGSAAARDTSLCHVSTGLAGRTGARVNGDATVVLAESIAAGDPECRLKIWLGTPREEVRGEEHLWPPTAGQAAGTAPHLDLAVSLPSETGSVPVMRRLAGQALRAFGVNDDHIHDVQLAITEACANVIDHALDSDTYEVQVELASHRCTITVIDQGGGFDSTAVPEEAEMSAEAGRGLALMRTLTDNVAFHNEPQAGTVVHMVKNLEFDSTHPLWRQEDSTTEATG
jgi:serine/threonine-protein kinase RsbW